MVCKYEWKMKQLYVQKYVSQCFYNLVKGQSHEIFSHCYSGIYSYKAQIWS
jgi:hypothetical protein